MKWAIRSHRSFPLSNLSESLTVAHFLWTTWVIRSRSLICLERSEQIAHSRSFDLSEMSKMSKWAMSKWANSQPWKWWSWPCSHKFTFYFRFNSKWWSWPCLLRPLFFCWVSAFLCVPVFKPWGNNIVIAICVGNVVVECRLLFRHAAGRWGACMHSVRATRCVRIYAIVPG